VQCAILRNRGKETAAKRKQKKADLEKLKTLSDHHKETQSVFNRYIRLRDQADNLPCISCNRDTGSQRHAGHFKPVGGYPELRYNPDNVHSQCAHCNDWLSGNLALYRARLLDKIGPERLRALEGPQEPRQYRVEDLKAIQAEYKAKIRELKRNNTQDSH
jgi:hypothetical protein